MDFAVIAHSPGRGRCEVTSTETWGKLCISDRLEQKFRTATLIPMGSHVADSLLPPLHRVRIAGVSEDFLVLAGREACPETGPVRVWSCRRPLTIERQVVANRKAEHANVDAAHLHWWDEMVRGPHRLHIPITEIRDRFGFSHDVLWRFLDWVVADHRGHLEGSSDHPEFGVLYVHLPSVREHYVYRERSWRT